jgi:hypothetical protein
MGQAIPPWEVDGLPDGIRARDLDNARTFYMTGIFTWGRRLVPTHPDSFGVYFMLSGTHYEHNETRLTQLAALAPIYRDERGAYYPAILLPDPTRDPKARPLAVCSYTGYIGSAWQPEATALWPEAWDARSRGQYLITRLQLSHSAEEIFPSVWLPANLNR